MKYAYLPIIALILMVSIVNCSQKNERIYSEVVKVDEGYGYKIYRNEKLLIKQLSIPTINKRLAFCDSIDALKISNIVVDKLKNNEAPIITLDHIKNQKIKLDCLKSLKL